MAMRDKAGLAGRSTNSVARILIVEGQPVVAADIEYLLRRAGYPAIEVAATIDEGMQAFHRHSPDLLITEMQLADGSSGIDLINAVAGLSDIPVIVVTAFPERLLLAERPKSIMLLTKPYQPESLVAAVDQALNKAGGRLPPSPEARELSSAASSALQALRGVEPASPAQGSVVGLGHNGPQYDGPLDEADYRAVSASLISLIGAGSLSSDQMNDAEATLSAASVKVASWVKERFKSIESGFFEQLGASLADWKLVAAAWLILSGKLDAVIAALHNFHGR